MIFLRILIATDQFSPMTGGLVAAIERLALNLKSRSHSVLILAPSKTHSQKSYFHKGLRVIGFPSFSVPFLETKVYIPYPFLINNLTRQTIEEFNPDIVHIESCYAIGKSALKYANQIGIPVVATSHFIPENIIFQFHLPKFAECKAKEVIWEQIFESFGQADAVTIPTSTAAKFTKKWVFQKK